MAIAQMEKLALNFKAEYLDQILQLIQGFQGIHIETGFESSIPSGKKNEIDRDIRELEKNLQDIQAAHNILKGRESNVMGLLKNNEEKMLSIDELIARVEESNWEAVLEEVIHTDRNLTDNRARRLEVTRLRNDLGIWERLNCNPLDVLRLGRVSSYFGSVHKMHAEDFIENLEKYEEDGVFYEAVSDDTNTERVHFFLMCHKSMDDKLNIIINEFSYSAEEYRFDKPQEEIKRDLEDEENSLLQEEKEINELIIEQAKYDEILSFAEDYNLNNLLRKKKSLEVTYDGGDIAINGWIVAEKRAQFEKILAANIPKDDYILLIISVKEKDLPDVPIKLKNPKIISVYEQLTEMYSLPRYDEIDPTPVMTVFYLIFFGMMVADIGYGLAIFLVGLAVRKILKVKRSTRKFVDFLFYLSFPIMGWGVVYGSLCGIKMPFGLISTTVDIIPMIVISIALGYLHIMAGLIIQVINLIRHKRFFDMMTGGLSWILVLLGGGVMVVEMFVPFLYHLGIWITGEIILGAGLFMMIILPAFQYGKRWYMGLGKGLYTLYGAISYLGDFVSYTRLMALGVAGGSVSLAFNAILAYLPLPVRFTFGIVLAVALHALNIFLSGLSAYVHGIRLQFIEFFGKFYSGGGKKFEPFKAAEKNVIIIENNRSDKEE